MSVFHISFDYLLLNENCHYPRNIKLINLGKKLDDLNNPELVRNLFAELNIPYTKETDALVGKKFNQRVALKNEFGVELDKEYLKERIKKYFNKISENGINIPNTLYI